MRPLFRSVALAVAVGFGAPRPATAEVSARDLIDALAAPRELGTGVARPGAVTPFVLHHGRLPVLIRASSAAALAAAGLGELVPGFGAAELTPAEVRAWSALPGLSVIWSPPLVPQLDRVREWIELGPVRSSSGPTGRGVVVGIVDTAIDLGHGDLRDVSGELRAAYYLDFSAASGPEPALEDEYCTATGGACAIYSAADLAALYSNDVSGDEPADPFGHGTHVASLAVGSGRGTIDLPYVGVAPEATLIAVHLTRDDGTIVPSDVVRAVRFVFERAEALAMPAVVNLSLGTDFGAHDGSSPLEQALAELVGPEHPGRALVVAAGNGGTLYEDRGGAYPGPFGIHTELRVPEGTSARAPLLTPSLESTVSGAFYVWIGFDAGDELAVGLDRRSGTWIAPVPRGQTEAWADDSLEITVVNQEAARDDATVGPHAAALIVHGEWPADTVFAIRLEGRGTARMWVQSAGALLSGGGSLGAVFAAASTRGTVNLPATHPDLIAAGALVNRHGWPVRGGHDVAFDAPVGVLADFSASGPTADGRLKPEVSAPGDYVVGAMAFASDPKWNGGSGLFAGDEHCELEHCHVVDDFHGVASGTSMAAPIVAGAVALLLEREPTLDQRAIRGLLEAGATRLGGAAGGARAGVGLLDVARSLTALDGGDALHGEPSPERSYLVLGDDFARPGGGARLHGVATLRTTDDAIADGAAPPRLTLTVTHGDVVEPLTRQAPGSYAFAVAARPGTGGDELVVRLELDGDRLTSVTVPIAIDRHLVSGLASARGGCAVAAPNLFFASSSSSSSSSSSGAYALLLAGLGLVRRRRRQPERCSRRVRAQIGVR